MTLTLSVKFPQIGIGIASAFDKKFGAEGTAGIKTCDPSLMLGVQRATTTTVDGVIYSSYIYHEVTQRGRVSELFEICKERVHRWYFSVTASLYGSAAGEGKPADEADDCETRAAGRMPVHRWRATMAGQKVKSFIVWSQH